MILDELAEPDRHPLFVAFRDEDQIDRQLAGDRLDRHQGVPLDDLRSLGVGRAAADQHLLERRLLDQPAFEGRRDPDIGLRHRHRVVHPVDDQRARRPFVAPRVDDRIALGAPLRRADVVDARLLASELFEEPFDHLGRLGNALAGVRDARLLNPLLKGLDVLVDVLVDVGEDLLKLGRRDADSCRVESRCHLRAGYRGSPAAGLG